MTEDNVSFKMIAQTSDSIEKLFEINTRIDERVKEMQHRQGAFEARLEGVISGYQEVIQKVAVLESKDGSMILNDVNKCKEELAKIDKRLLVAEKSNDLSKDRWNRVFTFTMQLVWVLLAAWLLMKLNLQSPSVP